MQNVVIYYRVSTKQQGRSGLGLESQRHIVNSTLKPTQRVVAEFTEIESGRRAGRVELGKAIDTCRAFRAKLIIAKLDRLSRNVSFISSLMDSDIEFIAADMPFASRLTLHLLAAVAEHEQKMISIRTKEALSAAKARGVRLGGNRGSSVLPSSQKMGVEAIQKIADRNARQIEKVIRKIQCQAPATNAMVAAELNRLGIPTPRNGRKGWTSIQVARAVNRIS